MFHFNQTCLTLERGDRDYFDDPVVINNKYLAVGDAVANKVIIYTRSNFGKWRKTREILPPEGSTPHKYGEGFGTELQLDEKVLAISAIITRGIKEVTNPEDFTQ